MKKKATPRLLALSIATILFPFTSSYAALSVTSPDGGNTVNVNGDGTVFNGPIIQSSGATGSGAHKLNVNNVNLGGGLTSDTSFTGMNYHAAISLAGNNGSLATATPAQQYGSLSLSVKNSSINGNYNGTEFAGVYARTDSVNAKLDVISNSLITISGSGRVNGMLIEAFGSQAVADVTLEKGSNIKVTGSVANTGSSGISVVGSGSGKVTTQAGSSISTMGDGVVGIDLSAGASGGTIVNGGDINTSGSGSLGMNIRTAGEINASNSGTISSNGSNSHLINVNSTASANTTVVNSGVLASTGQNSHAINASANGNISVSNTGNINTSGAGSHGVNASIRTGGTGKIEVVNSNKITTLGGSANGINATGAGDITIGNTGIIDTSGAGSHGVNAKVSTGGAGKISVVNDGTIKISGDNGLGINAEGENDITIGNNGNINTSGSGSHGVNAKVNTGGTGKINIVNDGTITTSGINGQGIRAEGLNDITIGNRGDISTSGLSSHGINAVVNAGAKGKITVSNKSTITTAGESAHGIRAWGENDITVENTGHIQINGAKSVGIYAVSSTGNVNITNTGTIETVDEKGINGLTGSGNVVINASNNITTGQTSSTSYSHGIEAGIRTGAGNIEVNYDSGTIKVAGQSIGIAAWDAGSGNAGVNASINLGANAIIDATEAVGAGLQLRSNGTGNINIAKGAQVHGGGNGIEIFAMKNGIAGTYTVDNAGVVDSMNDRVMQVSVVAGSKLTVNNTGTMTGYMVLGDEDSVFNNMSSDSWDIRNFTDTDGDQVRDTKAVAVSNFGGGYDVFKNEAEGTVRLAAVSGESSVNTANEYLTGGAQSIANEGISQAHLLNLDSFENRGIIDLSGNGKAGDLLLMSGGSTVGSYGGGKFVADGGAILLDVVLNEGGVNSVSDMLVVDDVVAGSSKTKLVINQVGGLGKMTTGDGIKVVEVLGTSDKDAFELEERVIAGAYEYVLQQGSNIAPVDQSYFLRTNASLINADVGSYLANQSAATSLFMHSLHDRLGEPQYYQNYKSEGRASPAFWLRATAGYTKSEAAGHSLKQDTDNNVIHFGGEVANWTGNGDDRYHLGLMGAYGRSETTTMNKFTRNKVGSKVDGYGAGAYFTWFDNSASSQGWYSDVWSMYNWFNNEADGSDKYKSRSWNSSIEVGYAARIMALENYNWMIEPQGQLTYNYYSLKDSSIKGRNKLTVTDTDANGIVGRLGLRTYLRPSTNPNAMQPFMEVNWLYNNAESSIEVNDSDTFSDDKPENIVEVKTGLQGEIAKDLHIYGQIGFQWGKSYENGETQLGVRYRF